jgi:hypothetical protein
MEYMVVGLPRLDLGREASFRFRWKLPGEEGSGEADADLIRSVGEHGIISPPILADTGDALEAVSGFRRLAAARAAGLEEVPALTLAARGGSRGGILRLWLETSLHGRPLSDMEKITLTARTVSKAGDGLADLLPCLSRLFARKITADLAARLAALSGLCLEAKEALSGGTLSAGDLLQLGDHPGIDLDSAARILATASLSRSARREAIRGMLSLADGGEGAFSRFAVDIERGGAPLDETVRSITHPRLQEDTALILGAVREMGLPPGTSIHLPENLEGGSCTVEIRVRGEDPLRLSLERLREGLDTGLVGKILDTLQGKG